MKLPRHRHPGRMLAVLKRHLYPAAPSSPEQARALVRRDHARGDSYQVIATRYGLDPATVGTIVETTE